MSEETGFKETKIYSFGDILVGLDSEEMTESAEIVELREKFSKIAEDLKDNYNLNRSPVKSLLFDQTIGDLTRALLMSEKLLKMK
jgi:hypothetical protein